MRFGFEKFIIAMIILVLVAGFLSGSISKITGKATGEMYKVYPYTIDLGGGQKLLTDHIILESTNILKGHSIVLCKGNCITFTADDMTCASPYMCSHEISGASGNTLTADVDGKRVANAFIEGSVATQQQISTTSIVTTTQGTTTQSTSTVSSCADSDGGYNPVKEGTVTSTIVGIVSYYRDSCISGSTLVDKGDSLREYSCKGNSVTDKMVECECAFGKCVREEKLGEAQEGAEEKSDEGSKLELYLKWINANGKGTVGPQILKQEDNEKRKPTCEDSEGNPNANDAAPVRGTVTGADEDGIPFEHTDECLNDNTLGEWICALEGNSYVPERVDLDCENKCMDSACERKNEEVGIFGRLIIKLRRWIYPEPEDWQSNPGVLGRKG